VISGITPNHALNAGRAWLSSRPSPLTVDVAAGARRCEQRRFRRDVDQVTDDRALRKAIERNLEWRLARHAEARRVGQHRNAVERVVALVPRQHFHHGADGVGDLLCLVERSIGEPDLGRALRSQACDHRTRRAARAQHGDWPRIGPPLRVDVAEALDEAVAVVVEARQRSVLLDDDGVDGADLSSELVDAV
jgi:hypothetical protein